MEVRVGLEDHTEEGTDALGVQGLGVAGLVQAHIRRKQAHELVDIETVASIGPGSNIVVRNWTVDGCLSCRRYIPGRERDAGHGRFD